MKVDNVAMRHITEAGLPAAGSGKRTVEAEDDYFGELAGACSPNIHPIVTVYSLMLIYEADIVYS